MGGLDMLEAFSMRKPPRAYFSDPVHTPGSLRRKRDGLYNPGNSTDGYTSGYPLGVSWSLAY
eukprot:scaffold54595_cov40-Phaeocystis_antarctica.AAC.1